ncbi:Flp family type IVb pilin [Hyphomicrobium sp.]|uniref:Flp family type IVb pilin n=1 Tax=Hyphomicrobium sp. TaxID=82 RepID=UPI002E35C722|nr:Flp family type IVb pilin [Hyphomicrobium sp.]HEX2841932.1 Flp family type IVb pilin [Hyphomicrobium sp.]
MVRLAKHFWNDESGASAIEYGLLAAFLGMGLVFSLTSLQGSLTGLFSEIEGQIPD